MTAVAALTPGRRAAVLLAWLALLAGAALLIARTPFSADLSAFMPSSPDARQRVLIEQVGSGVPARTLLIGIEGGDAKLRADASRALAARLRASGLFEQVHNGERSDWAEVGGWLVEHRYQLSPAVEPRRFGVDGLRDAIDETLSLLGTPAGQAIKPLLDRDPTGETQRIAEGLIPSSAPRSEQGVWAARAGERALLVASTHAPGSDIDGQAAAQALLREAFAALDAPGLGLQVGGAPVFAVESRSRIESEVRFLAIAGTVLLTTLLLAAFASLRALGVAVLPVASGVLAGIAAVGVVFGGVHGITLGFGTTLIGEAVDYAIYFLVQSRDGGWRRWLGSGWPTVRLGLLTSLCGFGALMFSGFPGLAQLGVFTVCGLLGAALTTRFVLPVLMPEGARGQGLRRQLAQLGRWAIERLPRLRGPLLVLGLVAAIVLAARGDLWRAELTSLSPISAQTLAVDASLRADLSAGDARALVVVEAPELETVLQRAEAAAARLDPLVESGAIGGWDSVTRWLPSLATQRARQAALPAAEPLRAALAQATQGSPLRAERLQPFIDEVQQARTMAPITHAALQGTALKPIVDALLLHRADGSWVALLPLQPGPGDRIDATAVTQALQGLEGTQLLEIGRALAELYERYLGEAQAQALLGALLVVALMALVLRSWRRLLAVCQPLLLAVLLTMGTLALLGVQLGILHLVGLLLVVAVGSNYALFFDMLQRSGTVDADTLASLLLANLTTVLSFTLIALSDIPPLAAVGRVVAPGTLLALLLAAAFARPPAAAPKAL